FIILPGTRPEERVLARAAGEEVRTVVAGYHWFTDWGRDTMISLEGLTLCTGRHHEARAILRTFAHYVQDGLLPNLFPEGERTALYHTVDATLWYFHALDRYYQVTGDKETLQVLYPVLRSIIEHHIRGTHFGIGVDSQDGLIQAGAEGYQLTWMDAKVGDWVVTPRRGKPVEIQSLWYNALRLMDAWAEELGEPTETFVAAARQAYASFSARFWFEPGRYLFDVIDGESGDDPSLRPNQIFSLSLRFPILDKQLWRPVLDTVTEKLLTPVGIRTLAPGHTDYKPFYDGDLRSRDAAYHQGTVWPWLIGHFVDAWRRVYPDGRQAHAFLQGFKEHLRDAGIGTISEIFDAEPPYTPRGCIAQAWSVAEVLRAFLASGEESSHS
ncbi:MAG: amylo-alpha-1,6-glucosidase, partial [Candidatus Binatia bacterium]